MNKMMTIQQVAERLKDMHLPDVQSATGFSYNTLKNVRDGKGAQYFTVQKLSNYFADMDAKAEELDAAASVAYQKYLDGKNN